MALTVMSRDGRYEMISIFANISLSISKNEHDIDIVRYRYDIQNPSYRSRLDIISISSIISRKYRWHKKNYVSIKNYKLLNLIKFNLF